MANAHDEDVVYDEAYANVEDADFVNPAYNEEDDEDPLEDQLLDAIYQSDIPRITNLLERGADIHAWGEYPLRGASGDGKTEIVRLLLEHGANVNECDDGALCVAIFGGHAETVKLLLDYGADPNAHNLVYLEGGVIEGHVETVKILLDYGGNPENIYMDQMLRFMEEERRKVFEKGLREMRRYVPVNPRRLRCV
jgi:ankyrin repeat protein